MNAPAKGCLAGFLSWKFGGGVFGTVVLFVIIYALLGNC
jgi:hypothetical protein